MNLIDKLHASWRASQQRYAPAVHRARQGWQALAPRERRLVQCAGAVLGAALVWTLLIEPPLKTLNQYRDELPKLRAQAAQVADLTAQADLLRRRAPAASSAMPAAEELAASLARAGLSAEQWKLEPAEGKSPALVLIVRQAPSSVLMNWLDGASRDWGLTVAGAELERAANPHGRPLPGLVNGRVTLAPAAGQAS